uniref:Uncharacterized protein n=1 Tax=Trichogramma kaykai TaxID=54128 RepID=A0ABD2X9Z5_9HYME
MTQTYCQPAQDFLIYHSYRKNNDARAELTALHNSRHSSARVESFSPCGIIRVSVNFHGTKQSLRFTRAHSCGTFWLN